MTTAILASDFSDRVTDTNRRAWTLGKMRHAIAALDGRDVAIITDRQTGHVTFGRLIECFDGGPSRGPRVMVESDLSDGTVQRTTFWLHGIGETIIPLSERLGERGAKWTALETWREEKSRAIRWAAERHGEVEGRAWGSWTAEPHDYFVSVAYEPSTGNPAFSGQWGERGHWRVNLRDLEGVPA